MTRYLAYFIIGAIFALSLAVALDGQKASPPIDKPPLWKI